jgi:ankyrin repeat protein
MYAIKFKKNKAVDYLISKGANLSIQAKDGKSALHMAMLYKNDHAIESLLYRKAPVTIVDNQGNAPFRLYPDIPYSLALTTFEACSDPNQALLYACYLGRITLMQQSINDGASANIQDKDGNSPLMLIIKHQNPQMLAFILQHKPNLDLKNAKGQQAIDVAVEIGNEYIWSIIKTEQDKRTLGSAVATHHYAPKHHHKGHTSPKKAKGTAHRASQGIAKKTISLIPNK